MPIESLSQDIERLHAVLVAWHHHIQSQVAQQALNLTDIRTLARLFREHATHAPDLVVQETGSRLVVWIDGLVDSQELTTFLKSDSPDTLDNIGHSSRPVQLWSRVISGVWRGQTAIVTAKKPGAVLIDFAKPPHRDIESPVTEQTIRGPQDAFVELENVKIAQIRERLATPDLVVERLSIGLRFPTCCDLIYCESLASPEVITRVRDRLRSLTLDSATNATRLGSLIRDHPWALFPTVRYSERVDWVALQLQSGKVALSIQGDPFVLTVPATLSDFYRTSEDYNAAWYDASFIRIIRLLAWAFGVMLPGWYIALTEVNPDLISPTLFNIIAGSHTGLPFTPFVEVVVMILVIEVLREAAVRLPKVLATTLGTVGAIVVGTAVVKAGFVSPQIIVLMTFTALSLFSVPTYELLATWRFMSWGVLVGAFVLGIYGVMLVTLAMSVELVSLTSFGTPYLSPLSPWRPKDWENFTWRVPWRALRRRLTEGRATDLRWTDDA